MSIFAWIATAWHWFAAQFLIADAKHEADPAFAIIRAQNYAIGPMPVTGGIIHRLSDRDLLFNLSLIEESAKKQGLDLALVLAWVCGESRFDHLAINPNLQSKKPGETEEEAFRHADIGIGQFDGATLLGMPEFKDRPFREVQKTAFDPAWAIPYFCKYVADLFAWAKRSIDIEPFLASGDPARNTPRLAIQAYNAGRSGALQLARLRGPMKYADSILARRDTFAKALGLV